ncbi:MAG: hypothetical protein WC747_03645 [Candidatus Babeliales bacterium]
MFKNKLTVCMLFIFSGFVSIVGSENLHDSKTEQECFPFANSPELSWNQFEKNFRNSYKDINIPTIVFDDACDFAPMFIHDLKDEYLTKFNEHRTHLQQPPFIIMSMKAAGICTPAQVEYVLLHEIGHHNYNREQNEYNHARAKIIAHRVNSAAPCGLAALNVGLLYHNVCRLSQKTIPKKALFAQALALMAYAKMTEISKSIETLCDDVIGTRPEEFWADDFAHQHASMQALQAGYHLWSKDHFISNCSFDFVQNFQTDAKMQAEDPEVQKVMLKIAEYMNSSEHFILSGLYNVCGLLCPSHPSPYQRQQLVGQALKDRFGSEV